MSFHPYMDNDSGGNPTPPLHLTRYSPWPEIITQGESNTLGNKRLQGWNKTNIAQAITGGLIFLCFVQQCRLSLLQDVLCSSELCLLQAQNIMYCSAIDSACYRLSRLQAQNIMYCSAADFACYRLRILCFVQQ